MLLHSSMTRTCTWSDTYETGTGLCEPLRLLTVCVYLFRFIPKKKIGWWRHRKNKLHSVSSLLLPFTLLCFNIEPANQSKMLGPGKGFFARSSTSKETELAGRFERSQPTLSAAGFGDFPQSFRGG